MLSGPIWHYHGCQTIILSNISLDLKVMKLRKQLKQRFSVKAYDIVIVAYSELGFYVQGLSA